MVSIAKCSVLVEDTNFGVSDDYETSSFLAIPIECEVEGFEHDSLILPFLFLLLI